MPSADKPAQTKQSANSKRPRQLGVLLGGVTSK